MSRQITMPIEAVLVLRSRDEVRFVALALDLAFLELTNPARAAAPELAEHARMSDLARHQLRERIEVMGVDAAQAVCVRANQLARATEINDEHDEEAK